MIYLIFILVYILVILGMVLTRNYERPFISSLSKKEHSLILFYPLALYVAHFFDHPKSERFKARLDRIRMLHANENVKEQYKLFRAKQFSMIVMGILILNSILMILQFTNHEEPLIQNGQINRPSYGTEKTDVDVDVIFNNDSDYIKEHMTIPVQPKKYTSEEFEKAVEKAKDYLNKNILGENVSLEKIYYPLNLVSSIPDSGILVEWQFENDTLIENDGSIHHRGLTDSKLENLTAIMKSGEFEHQYNMALTLLPEQLSKEDSLLYHLQDSLSKNSEETSTLDKLTLPDQVDGHEVFYEEPKKNSLGAMFLFGIVILVLLFLVIEQQLLKQKEERDIEIMMDYPEIINKFVLLMGAGMTIKSAWEKIVTEYEERKSKRKNVRRYAYEELKVTLVELNNGLNESRAYENFGRRMQLLPYMKLGSLLAQNVSKGMDGMLKSLEIEAYSAFEERKELAKRLGEKAGTKLLLPMGIMMCLVFIMIMIPAILSF